MPGALTLGRDERLKSRKEIDLLFKSGKTLIHTPFRVHYLHRSSPLSLEKNNKSHAVKNSPVQFGIGVPTRNFKKAVDRNRIKRLVREAWRIQKTELLEVIQNSNGELKVFLIFTGKVEPSFDEVTKKTAGIIQKLLGIVVKA